MRMKGETAIVTGSTSGIGKKLSELFLKEGCKVAICSRKEQKVNKTVSEFQEKFGDSVIGQTCDVSDVISMKKMVAKTVNNFDSIRILVANAGINITYGPFEKMAPYPEKIVSDTEEMLATNLIGVINSISTVLPHMTKQGYGRIIVVGGGHAVRPGPHMTLYSASKGGVLAFSKCLAEELKERDDNIKINIFQPGMIETNLGKNIRIVKGWKTEEVFNRETSLAMKYIGANIEESCSKAIPFALSSCKANGKVFRGFSMMKMIRGGRKFQKVIKNQEKK
ncbi:MAG: SDR family NAD(P)-dependent oxidoreductase [Candidatus Hodarchaeales archaeon]|jgi:NAD(P)-dependent dehydrogenase (short-subunit alcohol dehydrogenase family)